MTTTYQLRKRRKAPAPKAPPPPPRPPGKRGRKTLLDDPVRRQEILDTLFVGMTAERAIESAGIGKTAFYEYLKRPENAEFAATVKAADPKREKWLLTHLSKAQKEGDVRAIQFELASRWPERWGKRILFGAKGDGAEVGLTVDAAKELAALFLVQQQKG